MLAVTTLSFTLGTSANAGVIFDGSNEVSSFGNVSSTSWYAQNFDVTSTPGGSEITVTVNISHINSSSSGFQLQLCNDSAGHLPGSTILTLANNYIPSAAGDVSFSGTATLVNGGEYWVTMGVPSGSGSYRWTAGFSSPTQGSSAFGYASSADGASWTANGTGATFDMQVSAVPEPEMAVSALSLVVLAGAAFTAHRHRVAAEPTSRL